MPINYNSFIFSSPNLSCFYIAHSKFATSLFSSTHSNCWQKYGVYGYEQLQHAKGAIEQAKVWWKWNDVMAEIAEGS